MDRFDELVRIVARLRSEGGCDWDRAQTPESMRPYVLEETYEVLDAIDRGDVAELKKELGDHLFHVVMLARMHEECGDFDVDAVLEQVNAKMIRRHPHVFDPDHAGGGGDIASWEARKATERAARTSALDGIPRAFPALLRAHRVSEKASAVGFDWPDRQGVWDKVLEEIDELRDELAADDADRITAEYGDVLFALVNLGRFLPVGAEEALRLATDRFERRFRAVEQRLVAEGRSVHDSDLDALEAAWQAVKASEPC